MFLVLSGRVRYRVGAVEDEAGPGDLVVMASGVPHSGRVVGDLPAEIVEVKNIVPEGAR